jgi:hypothetical protein
LALEARRTQDGYDPRLYPVLVSRAILAWVFRWSVDDVANRFVGSTEACAAARHLEFLSSLSFRSALGPSDGDSFEVRFL